MKKVFVSIVIIMLSVNMFAVFRQYRCFETDIEQVLFREGDLMIATMGLYDDAFLFDVSDPYNIELLSALPFEVYYPYKFDAVISGDYLIAAYGNLEVFDISNPNSPELVVETSLAPTCHPFYGASTNTLDASDTLIVYSWYYYDEDYEDYIYCSDCWDVSDPLNPQHLPVSVGGYMSDVEIKGDIVFIARNDVVTAYDASNSDSWPQLSQVAADGYLGAHGDCLYVSSWDEGKLISIDVSDPGNMQRLDDVQSRAGHIDFVGDIAISYRAESIIHFIDVSDPAHLERLDDFAAVTNCPIDLGDQRIMVIDNGFARCLDLSNPGNDRLIGTFAGYDIDTDHVEINFCKLFDDTLYLVQVQDLIIADFSDLNNPEAIATLDWLSWPQDILLVDDVLFLSELNHGVRLYDVSDPTQPIQIREHTPFSHDRLYGLEIADETMYMTEPGHIVRSSVSDLDYPIYLGATDAPLLFEDIRAANGFLYAWTEENILQIYDIEEDGDLQCLSTIFPGVIQDVQFYLNDLYIITETAIKIYDLIEPATPQLVGTVRMDDGNLFSASCIVENNLIVADNMWNRLLLFDIANPIQPEQTGVYYWNQITSQIIHCDGCLVLNNRYGGINVLEIEAVGTHELAIEEPEIVLNNYPNPFNPSTTIRFSLKEDSDVILEIFNIKGQRVKTLVRERLKKGEHGLQWNGDDDRGEPVSSGVYLYRMQAGKHAVMQKMLMIK